VENQIVGAPCGVMDQMTAACGEANKLLAMVFQVSAISSGENNSAVFVLQIKKIMSNLNLCSLLMEQAAQRWSRFLLIWKLKSFHLTKTKEDKGEVRD
jgi:galactokinase